MEYFAGATGLIAGLVVGFVGGYLTASWWGKPARILKEAADKGIDVAGEVRRRMR